MGIRFIKDENKFILSTKKTSYSFEILENRYLRHLYYGKRTSRTEGGKLRSVSFSPYIKELESKYSPDTLPCEISFFGSGDFRATSLRLFGADGTGVCDFVYDSFRIFKGRREIEGLVCARADQNTSTLEITMLDPILNCKLLLYYTVFENYDIISRYMVLENLGESDIKIDRSMSLELCLDRCDLDMISLYGAYGKECTYQRFPLHHGAQTMMSRRGASSHQFNPFLALCDHKANDTRGEVFGFNLVYSGSFENSVEVDQLNTTKVVMGLGDECFSYTLSRGERFESPEAIMTYSANGLGKMSRNFHSFIRETIMPKSAFLPHDVVLNTWEACYFDIDAQKMLDFAKESAACGFDMLVMDDGWFGARNNDDAGLGDWFENKNKFPMGLKAFAEQICQTGIKFGIWIEPEMVNPDSELFRSHPDWCLRVPDREPLLSRDQLVLDMSNPEVIEYLKNSFEKTFEGVPISYFKWDMNRHLCNIGSCKLPCEKQGEISFRYMKGVYSLLDWFNKKFPNAVIETCSGGGGRYDIAMMRYGVQIWTSDNTAPYNRTRIQSAALIAYPAMTMSCHVSNPCGDLRSLDFRYKVAVQGMLGYELNILKMSDKVKGEIARQIKEYKTFDEVIRLGDYYNLSAYDYSAYYYANKDNSKIVLSLIEKEGCKKGKTKLLKIKRALSDTVYVDSLSGAKYSGAELKKGIRLDLEGEENSAKLIVLCKA